MIGAIRLGGLLLAIALVSGIRDSSYSSSRTIDPTNVPLHHSRVDSLITAGEERYLEGDFNVAESTWREALELSRDVRDRRSEARILTWLGLAAYRTGDYEAAQRLGEEALALKLEHGPGAEIAKSYNALGLLAWNEGRLLEATRLFNQASEAARRENDEEIAAKAANNLGLVYSDLGEFGRARESFEASLNAGRELGDEVIEGRTLSNLGMLEIRTGDPAVGMRFLGAARSLYRKTGDVAGEINTLGQFATAYADLGEPRLAFAALDSSLGLARRHDLRSEEASSLELLAALYREAGDVRRALDLCEEARKLNHALGLQIEEASDLILAAEIQARIGDPTRAREMAVQAADLHHAAGATMEELRDLLLLAELDALLGRTASSRQNLEEASALVHRLDALSARQGLAMTEARIADRAADSRRVIGILTDAMPDLSVAGYNVLWEAEALRARAYARLGDLDAAAASGFRAVGAVERARERFGSSFLRTAFVADRRVVFTDLIDVLLEQGRVEEAFELADASRGRSFVERLPAVREMSSQAGGAVRMFAEGERLLREIDELVVRRDEIEALPPEERGDAPAQLRARLRQARARYEEVLVRIEESSGGNAALLGGGPKVRSGDVQRVLQGNETLLEYLVTSDRVILFEVTRAAVRAHSTRIPLHDLNRRLRVGHELSARSVGSSTSSRILENLHAVLLEPVSSIRSAAPRHLIVVTDAALDHTPFAALRDPHSGRYLVERHAVSYLPSAAALPILRGESRRTQQAAGSFDITVLVPLPKALPATREEANGVRRSVRSALVVEADAATEERVRQELGTGRIVHVASHGVLESSNPLFSRIELFRASDRSADDGRLEVHEVLGLTIRSPLVFLSGCETEASPTSRSFASGDDYATLARAFLYSGAQTVIATLWRIDDNGAALFASRYYQHLRELSPSEALARTQRDFIRSERYSEPYFWASYRLAGEGVRRL